MNSTQELKFSKESRRWKIAPECPCGKNNKNNKFVPYDGYTDKGYCHACDETFLPGLGDKDEVPKVVKTKPKSKPPSFTDPEAVRQTLTYELDNNLICFLIETFGDHAWQAIKKYRIGTDHKRWRGATIFWQIDRNGKVRGGKVMGYNSKTGERIKTQNTWHHSLHKYQDYNLQQCAFGEHLLRKTPETICVVESEKTALIASIVYPDHCWMAIGGLTSKPFEKCKALIGYRTILIPDIGAFDKWKAVANDLNQYPRADFIVSDFFERIKGEFEAKEIDVTGKDLADFLVEKELRYLPNSQEDNSSTHYFTSTGQKVWDPEGLLRLSGLDFLCEPESEVKQKFEYMAGKNPKIFKLKQRLGLQCD